MNREPPDQGQDFWHGGDAYGRDSSEGAAAGCLTMVILVIGFIAVSSVVEWIGQVFFTRGFY